MTPIDSHKAKEFSDKIGEKENRMLKAKMEHKRSVWMGLGMFGMVGWSVAIPTLLGALLGLWLDKNHPQSFSWTVTFLFSGLIAGSLIAWNWVAKEDDEMNGNEKERQ